MLSGIIKLVVTVGVTLVGLNLFAPHIYNQVIKEFSAVAGVDKNIIDSNINKVTSLVKTTEPLEKVEIVAEDGTDYTKLPFYQKTYLIMANEKKNSISSAKCFALRMTKYAYDHKFLDDKNENGKLDIGIENQKLYMKYMIDIAERCGLYINQQERVAFDRYKNM